jgi:RimJ/RimL family protein N-acetyltransferase
MKEIETKRITLRNFFPKDWQELRDIIVRYQESEFAKYDHKWLTDEEGIKKAVEWFSTGDSFLAVCLKSSGSLIGFISIDQQREQKEKTHNLGYIFHPEYQGHGYAFEGCKTAIDFVFNQLSADKILTATHPSNKPSVTLLRKLGLKEISQGEFMISKVEWQTRDCT